MEVSPPPPNRGKLTREHLISPIVQHPILEAIKHKTNCAHKYLCNVPLQNGRLKNVKNKSSVVFITQ